MPKAIATVYDPPATGQPYIAVIVMGGKVIVAEAVPSVEKGEEFLKHMLKSIAKMAADDGYI